MKKTRTLIASTAAVAALGLSALGLSATVAFSAQDATRQPVQYGADQGEYTPDGFALRGRAEVTQGTNRIRADAIRGFTNNGQLSRVEASGNVYFVTPDQSMRGNNAVYNLNDGTVVVTGDVVLTQGQNVLSGGRLVYNVRTETARIESAGNRVRGVFYPSN